ncbi:ParA family protein [Streptomyces sp. MMS24-I2-30]|uniref:ParA family protein n=1 Tax=Streptomyces sp. MMS24-I2-30 TaxID=3351564 RepID=UPI003896AD66
MSRVLAVYSEKGGVGKSALSAGLVAAARKRKLSVIAGDLDPRGTFTAELGISADEAPAFSMNDLLALDPQGETGLATDAFAEAGRPGPACRSSLRSGLSPTGRPTTWLSASSSGCGWG